MLFTDPLSNELITVRMTPTLLLVILQAHGLSFEGSVPFRPDVVDGMSPSAFRKLNDKEDTTTVHNIRDTSETNATRGMGTG